MEKAQRGRVPGVARSERANSVLYKRKAKLQRVMQLQTSNRREHGHTVSAAETRGYYRCFGGEGETDGGQCMYLS